MKSTPEYTPDYDLLAIGSYFLQRDLSEWGAKSGVNEHDIHSLIVHHMDVVANWLKSGQPIFIKKEAPMGGRHRSDCLIYFYGASSYDIIECKWVNEPLMKRTGELTNKCHNAINKLMKYRSALMTGQSKIVRTQLASCPRIILIGYDSYSGSDPEDAAGRIRAAMISSCWKQDYQQGRLLVTTWQTLNLITQDAVQRSRIAEKDLMSKSGHPQRRRTCNYLARSVLGLSFQSKKSWASDRSAIKDFICTETTSLVREHTNPAVRGIADEVQNRALRMIDRFVELGFLTKKPLESPNVNSLLLLGDILFYENDGDVACGQWEHMATYEAIKLIEDHPCVHGELNQKLTEIVRRDNSEDAIGMATHIARTMPKEIAQMWDTDAELSSRWEFTDNWFKDPGLRGLMMTHLHVAYTSALHGNDNAIEYLNSCADDRQALDVIATWNSTHAARDHEKLLNNLKVKATDPREELRPFIRYHKAVFETTKTKLEVIKDETL
jgi:hypothetical protein